jgi:serine/threonine-protein kinase
MNTASQSVLDTGVVLNEKWVILKLIGRGGMGEVYKAHQLSLDRDVAIKVVSQHWLEELSENAHAVENCLERFRREVKIMAQVRHPNVLQILDYGSISIKKGEEDSSVEYIAMELVSGGTLRATMSAEGFYPDAEKMIEWLCTCFLPLLDGVHVLHEAGIIHRDLKPENVLFEGTTPKIADFGLARSLHLKPVTLSVDMKGTPAYMSPEHLVDLKRADRQTDVYSLGKILYEAAAGKIGPEMMPFGKVSLSNPKRPFFQKLDRIIQDATAEARHERLPSAAALKRVIEELIDESKSSRERIGLIKDPAKRHGSWTRFTLTGVLVIALSGVLSAGTAFFLNERTDVPATSVDIAHTNGLQDQAPKAEEPTPPVAAAATDPLPASNPSEADSPFLHITEHGAAASAAVLEKSPAAESAAAAATKKKEISRKNYSTKANRKSREQLPRKSLAKTVPQHKPLGVTQGASNAKALPKSAGAAPHDIAREDSLNRTQALPLPSVLNRTPDRSSSKEGC